MRGALKSALGDISILYKGGLNSYCATLVPECYDEEQGNVTAKKYNKNGRKILILNKQKCSIS